MTKQELLDKAYISLANANGSREEIWKNGFEQGVIWLMNYLATLKPDSLKDELEFLKKEGWTSGTIF